MEIVQQNILRHAMKNLELSRIEFATKFNISTRRLDSWLLPDDSSGFRQMPYEFQNVVFGALREEEMKAAHGVTAGTADERVSTIHCDSFDFDFPTLYRITYAILMVDENTGEIQKEHREIRHGYSLCNNPSPCIGNAETLSSEPVYTRNTKTDSGRLYINEHRNMDRAEAFINAFVITQGEEFFFSIDQVFYSFNGRLFTLVWLPDYDNEMDSTTNYYADTYLANITHQCKDEEVSYVGENSWEKEFEKNEAIQVSAVKLSLVQDNGAAPLSLA